MVRAVRKHQRILQTGSMFRSDPIARHACELVRNGRIGQLQRIVTDVAENNAVSPGPGWKPMPVPEGFDYDLWLGPAPGRPITLPLLLSFPLHSRLFRRPDDELRLPFERAGAMGPGQGPRRAGRVRRPGRRVARARQPVHHGHEGGLSGRSMPTARNCCAGPRNGASAPALKERKAGSIFPGRDCKPPPHR